VRPSPIPLSPNAGSCASPDLTDDRAVDTRSSGAGSAAATDRDDGDARRSTGCLQESSRQLAPISRRGLDQHSAAGSARGAQRHSGPRHRASCRTAARRRRACCRTRGAPQGRRGAADPDDHPRPIDPRSVHRCVLVGRPHAHLRATYDQISRRHPGQQSRKSRPAPPAAEPARSARRPSRTGRSGNAGLPRKSMDSN